MRQSFNNPIDIEMAAMTIKNASQKRKPMSLLQKAALGGAPLVLLWAGGLIYMMSAASDQSGEGGQRLTFAALEQWNYDAARPGEPPEALRRHDGQERSITGYMFPLERLDQTDMIRLFALLKTEVTCCFGHAPEYNNFVFIEMAGPVRFTRRPVTVTGRFFIDPRPDEGYVFRMEGQALSAAEAEGLVRM